MKRLLFLLLILCLGASLLCACAGIASCMTVLYKFCAYADQNFSGIGDTMQPVSELYRDRLLPMLLPCAVCCVLAVWQMMSYDVKVYIQQKKEEKQKLENMVVKETEVVDIDFVSAPSIIGKGATVIRGNKIAPNVVFTEHKNVNLEAGRVTLWGDVFAIEEKTSKKRVH